VNPEKFLDSLIDYEKRHGYNYSLKKYVTFLQKIDSPHKKLKNTILIGGTKGKGSTAAILNSCLIAHGYRVGLYTSPHLEKIYERIKINNINISKKQLATHIDYMRPHIRKARGIRTFFEVLTTAAFLYFLKKKTDFSIFEVGLGGRLDATNATMPLMSVITKIGYDHTQSLGKKLSQIAHEKAGIIKRGIKLITIHQRPKVEDVLKKTAKIRKAPVIFAENKHKINVISESIHGTHLSITGELGTFKTFLPLVGHHQIENLLLALAILNELKNMGFKIAPLAVKRGIISTELHGRFEIVSHRPLIIYDCAHNQDSFEALARNFAFLKIKNIFLIFGCKKNKTIGYCLQKIFPQAREVVLVPINNPLGMDPRDIYKKAKKYQKNLTFMSSMKGALGYLKNKVDSNSVIIITGSFYLWNEITN
jgi:dihydrofolate synthase/folylpolyglutamate synthase